jgi:hypothetical protein
MNMPAPRFAMSGPESPLSGVHTAAWRRFIAALDVQPMNATSRSGGLGSYDIRPRRLVELGYATNLRSLKMNERQVCACDFVLPWTQARFLSDSVAQYVVLVKSMRAYYSALVVGDLEKPVDVSMAGALAVLHLGGRGALQKWPDLFENTKALYVKAQGAF